MQSIIYNGDAPMEFFVEGTRSRVGKSLHPKLGLLSMAVRPFFDRKCSDISMFPISITYNQRMESQLYVGKCQVRSDKEGDPTSPTFLHTIFCSHPSLHFVIYLFL